MTQRIDLYASIHKGIRAALFDLVTLAGSTDATDPVALGHLQDRLEHVSGLIRAHTHHEDLHLTGPVRQALPDRAEALEAHHEDQMRELGGIDSALLGLCSEGSPSPAALHGIYRRLSAWVGAFLVHLEEEEGILMPALHKTFDDDQLFAVQQAIRGSVPPQQMAAFMAYTLPALTIAECSGMLAGMRHGAPAPVYEGMRALAASVLSAERFAAVIERVEGVVQAA